MTRPLRLPLLLYLATLLVAGALGACAKPRAEGPQATLRRYVAAIRSNQPEIAYGVLDDATRQRVTLDEFRKRWLASPRELEAQAKLVEASLQKAPVITARILSDKGSFQLAYVKSWQFVAGMEVGGGGKTPEEAIMALLRAADNRDYLALKRLVTAPVARAFEDEINKRIKKIRDALKTKIVVRGNRAFLRSGSYKLELVKEDGQWRVADFD